MGFFQTLIQVFEKLGKGLSWFITAVVVPATIWFTVLKTDMVTLKAQTVQNSSDIDFIRREIHAAALRWEKDLAEIKRSLGRVEGYLEGNQRNQK
jgi:hypothetical protein